MTAVDTEVIVDTLLAWAEREHRDLPWRVTRDPWAILVSETMLQQTQVDRVVPKYLAFLERFPDPSTCAAAPPAEVVTQWAGLGYNRRAVNLHRAAVQIVDQHADIVPSDLDALLALPGVGPYTARAVLVFAYERDIGVVDTNVGRLLARLGGRSLGPKQAQTLADHLVPTGRSWAWNQGLFDLGAAVCTKRSPRCGECPVIAACAWAGQGPDPAEGSAATTQRQSRFDGSFRQGRGRLVAALRDRPVAVDEVAAVVEWDDPIAVERCIAGLVADGLVEIRGDAVVLAGG